MKHLDIVEQIEKEIQGFEIVEGKIVKEKWVEVKFEDYILEIKWEDVEKFLPLDKYKLATIIHLYYKEEEKNK